MYIVSNKSKDLVHCTDYKLNNVTTSNDGCAQ